MLDEPQQALLRLGQALSERGYRFTTVTPLTHERVTTRAGNAQARDLQGVFGWSRPFAAGLLDAELLGLMRAADVLVEESGQLRSAVRYSSLGEQLFVHSCYPTQQTDAVFFGPDSYRFVRAIEAFLQLSSNTTIERAVDIGCGAGPGAQSIALARPAAQVLAVDINSRALAFTRVNAALANVDNLRAQPSDLLGGVDGEFDLIVANPPYMLDSERRAYRDGGGDLGAGLSQAIVAAASTRLAPGGSLLLYTGVAMTAGGDPFLAYLQRTLGTSTLAWRYEEVDPDVFGEELSKPGYEDVQRIAAVVLTVTRTAS
ncbi:Methyltransferase small domain-containing protein [Pseudomonas flavescens]|uniref:Methyltransferase small domain-containing protein n=1 Tax=Phytopseudomonas flavescens TaxID=29435 RepID=A0A1G8CUF1_9GAMM|nr:class I SAM-dependent methyltransferase [Pseudomonas flavescens]SDH48799.1 Methyltransferase small domain-containing protein [Pseudomonas flavescens]